MLSLWLGLTAMNFTSHVAVNSAAEVLRRETVADWRRNSGSRGLITTCLKRIKAAKTTIRMAPTERMAIAPHHLAIIFNHLAIIPRQLIRRGGLLAWA
ncbi:hypothetical protein PRUPE_8G108200 [Prunus persica]|uniref:Transposase n=1 Tax=Prunus persica TaxID=3760 RepID=A0A251MW88_PRUPE|nr:hypothetical protein PRUPE_8G108200 [Prunus persica]